MLQRIIDFFKPKAATATVYGGWSSRKLPSGDLICTLDGEPRHMVLLKPSPTGAAYVFANITDLPMRRNLALSAALDIASRNYGNGELTEALAGVLRIAHSEKNITELRIKLQSALEAISARTNSNIQEQYLKGIAFPLMVLESENPFMWSDINNEKKAAILEGEPRDTDFFLSKVWQTLSS